MNDSLSHTTRDLIISLREQAKIYVGPSVTPPFWMEKSLAGEDASDFALPPELLVDESRRELVGISATIKTECMSIALRIVKDCDPNAVNMTRFVPRPPHNENACIEIVWGEPEPKHMVVASLVTSFWLGDDQTPPNTRSANVIGFGIGDIDFVLDEFGLTLPHQWRHPKLHVRSVDEP